MTKKIAACIKNGKVVNAAVYEETFSNDWLKAVEKDFDKVLIVDNAATDWEEYQEDKLRPTQPNEKFVWDEKSGIWVEQLS
jgi:hypothetical protein